MLVLELQHDLDPLSVGAKSANLGKILANGINAPSGFVLTREALGLFLDESGLLATVREHLDTRVDSVPKHRTQAYEAICDRVSTAPIPTALGASVDPFARRLLADAPCGLAVRSSGIYEDSATASFAGVYESYLGIRTPEELWVAIRRCWCATWAPSALEYAKRMGIDPEPDAMAVLVQPLIPAQSAGVLFTADPQTGNPWRFVLESTFGLSHELVGGTGATAADRFVLEWDSARIIERQIADKPVKWGGGVSGLEELALSDKERSAPSLTDEMASCIAQQALEIDRLFGSRVDIEWVVADATVFVVQVRPLTALPPFFPHHLTPREAEYVWRQPAPSDFTFGNPNTKVTSPLSRDLSTKMSGRFWPGVSEEQIHPLAVAEKDVNGHRYCAFVRSRGIASEEKQEAYLDRYEAEIRQALLDAKQRTYPAMLTKAAGLLGMPKSLNWLIEAILWVRDMFYELDGISAGPAQSLWVTTHKLLRSFLDQHAPGYDIDGLLQGYHPDLEPYYPHVQMREAQTLAETVVGGPIRRAFEEMEPADLFIHLFEEHESAPFMAAFADYCERFGLYMPDHRLWLGAGERHRDAISLVQDVLSGHAVDLSAVNERVTRQRQAYADGIRNVLADRSTDVLARFEKLLDWALFWGSALNDRGWAGVPKQRLHELRWRTWDAWEQLGLVGEPEFVNYTAEDLAHIAAVDDIEEGKRIWHQRCKEQERFARLQAPETLGATSEERPIAAPNRAPTEDRLEERDDHDSARIEGKRCVPGKCTGIAHKISVLEEADAAGGEHILLVTQPIQPRASNTPLLFSIMLRVRGMIIVDGPMMWTHHVAQIARECGVPIVQIGSDKMDRIPDGAKVELDGLQGTVSIQQGMA